MKKADNFDAKQWLVENKITTQSRLNEIISPSIVDKYSKMKSMLGDKAGDVELRKKIKDIIVNFLPLNLDVTFEDLVGDFGEEAANSVVTVLNGAYIDGYLDIDFKNFLDRLYNERDKY